MQTQKIKPSLGWLFLSLGAFLLSLAATAVMIFSIVSYVTKPSINLATTGTQTISVSKTKQYEIFCEYRWYSDLEEDVSFTFKNSSTGEVYESDTHSVYRNSTRYHVGDTRGARVGSVTLPKGTYEVQNTYTGDSADVRFVLREGSLLQMILVTVFSFVAGLLLFLLALISFILILVFRGRAKRRIETMQRMEYLKATAPAYPNQGQPYPPQNPEPEQPQNPDGQN